MSYDLTFIAPETTTPDLTFIAPETTTPDLTFIAPETTTPDLTFIASETNGLYNIVTEATVSADKTYYAKSGGSFIPLNVGTGEDVLIYALFRYGWRPVTTTEYDDKHRTYRRSTVPNPSSPDDLEVIPYNSQTNPIDDADADHPIYESFAVVSQLTDKFTIDADLYQELIAQSNTSLTVASIVYKAANETIEYRDYYEYAAFGSEGWESADVYNEAIHSYEGLKVGDEVIPCYYEMVMVPAKHFDLASAQNQNTFPYIWKKLLDDTVVADIQKAVARGEAAYYFNIGQEIACTKLRPDRKISGKPASLDTPFIVVHIGDCYDDKQNLHKNALYLMPKFIDFSVRFDAATGIDVDLTKEMVTKAGWYYYYNENSNWRPIDSSDAGFDLTSYAENGIRKSRLDPTYHYSINNGLSRWMISEARMWANADVDTYDKWWKPQYEGDIKASNNQEVGWIYGYPDEWKAVFKPIMVKTPWVTRDGYITDITYDKFFIPSVAQIYGVESYDSYDSDDVYFQYFKDAMSANSEPTNDMNSARAFTRRTVAVSSGQLVINTQLDPASLRSFNTMTSSYTNTVVPSSVRAISKTGGIGSSAKPSDYQYFPLITCIY